MLSMIQQLSDEYTPHGWDMDFNAIVDCLTKTGTEDKDTFASLVSWNFPSFKKVHILAV